MPASVPVSTPLRNPRLATQSATLGAMPFTSDELRLLDETAEVEIETQAPGNPVPNRTIIWIVVDGPDVFARSVRGARGRWYREAILNPAVAIEVDGRRIPAVALLASDPISIERASAALSRKYAGDPSTPLVLRPETLETTLRLAPPELA